jgi:hypothetical protein
MKISNIIVTLIHIITFIFIISVPWTNDPPLLLLYLITIPNLILHWYMRSNICSLTLMEKTIVGKLIGSKYNDSYCISCKIIDPIYDIPNQFTSQLNLIYIIMGILWVVAVYRLYTLYKNGEIQQYINLFIKK